MKRSTNNSEVKKLNRNRVFRYINDRDETCMPEISAALDISSPTVLTIVNELKEDNLITEVGEFKSTGGRKAKAIASIKDSRYTIGLDITKNHIGIICTDLSRKTLKYERVPKIFENSVRYFTELGDMVCRFAGENHISDEKIAGVGIAVPAIVDLERNLITNSRALDVYNVPCEKWKSFIPYPCEFINDANAAAMTENIRYSDKRSMVYLSLSNTVGGAIIFWTKEDEKNITEPLGGSFGKMYVGDEWRSGEFGHMVIHPNGKKCYCGKEGCLDAYCSALNLADLENGKLERFFEQMEAGNKAYRQIWNRYLDDLAIAVDNLRMCFDCEVVLGGYVGCYMEPYMSEVRRRVAEKNIFDDNGEYVRACKYKKAATALGAAIYQIEKFISSV
ncbi:MAG: ROK family transcriptional regulator [Lachnospiraceae bacterium]